MALFRKPKKNIRRRNVDFDEEEGVEKEDEPMDVELVGNGVKKSKEKKKDGDGQVKAATLLSFADEEEDHGEVFQVKKSSYSKKLERKLDKERRRRKDKMEVDEEVPKVVEPKTIPADDLVIIVKKEQEEVAREKQKRFILNGRAALMAGKNEASSSEDDEGSARYKFSQSNRAEITIESGKIPDAATIHAARKRRQRARQLNLDYIPVETPKPKPKAGQGTSRLVREEEEDGSDEERINMGTGLENNDMSARRAVYYEHVEPAAEPEPPAAPAWPIAGPVSALLPPPPPPCTNTKDLALPAVLTQRLRDRLAGLREMHTGHCSDVLRVAAELDEHTAQTARLEAEAPDLAAKFRFYQDMRGYVTDLVECLDEKVPGLTRLEESVLRLWTDRAANLAARRRLDIRDQADEMSQFPKGSAAPKWSREEEEARTRRAAEREGRRSRRRRMRELRSLAAPHVDGMSSDDEETELESGTFQNKLEEVERLSMGLLEDVEAEFGTVDGVARRLEGWREFDLEAYTEAYACLCLPKLLGPLVRLTLLTWNPLQQDASELDSSPWWNRLLLYGLKEDESLHSLSKDPDLLLIPVLLEKAILPKVADLVGSVWDPLSSAQTLRLVSFLTKCVGEMPGMSATSPQVTRLLDAVLARLRHAVDNDVFIPISFLGGEGKGGTSPFFQRQFASAVKLLRNMLSLHGLVGGTALHDLALDGLLNRYLLAALRTCAPTDAISKANMIISTFPRWWFQTETKIPKLEMLGRQLKNLSTQVQPFDTTEKDAHELVHSLLRTVQLACPTPL